MLVTRRRTPGVRGSRLVSSCRSPVQEEQEFYKARITHTRPRHAAVASDIVADLGRDLGRDLGAAGDVDKDQLGTNKGSEAGTEEVRVRYHGDPAGVWDEWVRVDGGRLRAPQDWSSGCSDDGDSDHQDRPHSPGNSDCGEVGPQGLFGDCNGKYWRVQGAAHTNEDKDLERPLLAVKATLIVCPTHIREQWHEEILRHTHDNTLKVVCYDGCRHSSQQPVRRGADGSDLGPVSLEQLAAADIGVSASLPRLSPPSCPSCPCLLSGGHKRAATVRA